MQTCLLFYFISFKCPYLLLNNLAPSHRFYTTSIFLSNISEFSKSICCLCKQLLVVLRMQFYFLFKLSSQSSIWYVLENDFLRFGYISAYFLFFFFVIFSFIFLFFYCNFTFGLFNKILHRCRNHKRHFVSYIK